jgi:2-methylisocitrate lyase-like PEP mutase family enzyme
MPRKSERPSWKKLLKREKFLQLPAAHDALAVKLIERAGFKAYQVGGFALDGACYGVPDIDLNRLGEKSAAVREIINASELPVLVDADDGYGDVKNVTHTIHIYDEMGASAIFIEDQQPPKRCGHMAGKRVIPSHEMAAKVRAAAAARNNKESLFLIARTDAIDTDGLDETLRRAELYLKSGADGLYIEGPHDLKQLAIIGREFRETPLAVTMLEGGGETPWVAPRELRQLGFSMALYPTTLLFRITQTIERALRDLRAGRPMPKSQAVSMKQFEEIVGIVYWAYVENRFKASEGVSLIQRFLQRIAA